MPSSGMQIRILPFHEGGEFKGIRAKMFGTETILNIEGAEAMARFLRQHPVGFDPEECDVIANALNLGAATWRQARAADSRRSLGRILTPEEVEDIRRHVSVYLDIKQWGWSQVRDLLTTLDDVLRHRNDGDWWARLVLKAKSLADLKGIAIGWPSSCPLPDTIPAALRLLLGAVDVWCRCRWQDFLTRYCNLPAARAEDMIRAIEALMGPDPEEKKP